MANKDQNIDDDLIILSDDDTETETFSDDILMDDEIKGSENVISFDSEASDFSFDEPREASHEMVLDDEKKKDIPEVEDTIDFGDLSNTDEPLIVEEVKKDDSLSDGYSFGGSSLGGVETMESILEDTIAKLNARKSIVDVDTKKEQDHIKDLQNKVKELEKDIKEAEENVSDLESEGQKIVNNISDLETMKKAASSKTSTKK